MKVKIFPLVCLIMANSVFPLAAQEQFENKDSVFVIREIEFDIDGRTRPFALMANGEFKEGERINGKENLDKYIALKRQLLINKQILEDVWIEYFPSGAEDDNAIPLKLLVHVKDSWNFIVLPYPKYDSNDGFSLTLKARDYNFLGTMSTLSVDLGYLQKDNDHTIGFSIESSTPFKAAGLYWNFNFDHYFEYTFNEPLYYQNVTGISVQLPWNITTFTVGFMQYLTINEENTDEDIDIYSLGGRFYGPYGSSELFVSWKIPLGIDVGDFGGLSYTPEVSSKFSYPYGAMDEPRKPVSTFSQTVGFGRINWINNYREGLSFSVGNAFSWYFNRSDAPLRITLDGDLAFHSLLKSFLGFSSHLKYRQWWHRSENINGWIPYYYAGDLLRGVLNSDIRADYMLSLNLDLPIRVLRFWPSEWFNNPKLHFFDFEMHLSPFTDMALLAGPYNKIKDEYNPMGSKTKFSFGDMINTAGLEIILFPGFFKSLKIRGSIGYNINKIKNGGFSLKWGFFPEWDEIFIGLDHFY